MAASIGNLAIVISGNAAPFNRTLHSVSNNIRQFSAQQQNIFIGKGASGGDASSRMGLQWGSFGRLARSALVAGFGGGLAGALVGVGAMAFGQLLQSTLGLAGAIGSQAASFLADSFKEGLSFQRMEMGVNFLAGSKETGAEWIKELRSLSVESGYGVNELGAGLRQLAGSSDDLDNVIPRMRAIAKLGAAVGLDAENLRLLALAIAQVQSAGRFEAQELNQLTEHGLPIKELARTAGMEVGEFRKAVRDGAVSVGILDQTLNRLSLESGGKFFAILTERSRSAIGQIDKLAASWSYFKINVGGALIKGMDDAGWLRAIQSGVEWLLQNQDKFAGIFKQAAAFAEEFAAVLLRVAGNVYDIVKGLVKMYDATKGVVKVASILVSPGGFLLGNALTRKGGTGGGWEKDFEEFMEKMRQPRLPSAQKPEKLIDENATPRLAESIQKLIDQNRTAMQKGATPYDEFASVLKSIEEAKRFAALTGSSPFKDGEEENMIASAFFDLERSLSQTVKEFPKALEMGTVEAASAMNQAVYGGSSRSVVEVLRDGLDIAKKHEARTKEVVDELRRNRRMDGTITFE